MRFSAVAILMFVLISGNCLGRTFYSTKYNNFESLSIHEQVEGEHLVLVNRHQAPYFSLDTLLISATTDYRYYARMANRHNKEGHSYKYFDADGGKERKIANPKWGIVFNFCDEYNYNAVVLHCSNSSIYDDVNDKRTLTVNLLQVVNGEEFLISSRELNEGLSLEDDFNVVGVDVVGTEAIVYCGSNRLEEVLRAEFERSASATAVGIFAGCGSKVAIERSVLDVANVTSININTGWTREKLDDYFSNSFDPIEGYWTYLDRDMEDKWLKLGGKYTIALVRTSEGEYDIVYVGGVQVNPDNWAEGLLKGHIKRTIFTNTFSATWIDAMLEPIDDEVQATIEQGVILTMRFPLYKSQVRFSKKMPDFETQ